MARKRGLFSTGTADALGGGMQGIFNGVMASEKIKNDRAAQQEIQRRTDIDRALAGIKLEDMARPTSVVTFGPDGKPQINIEQGTNPGRLDVLGGVIGLPPGAGGAAAPKMSNPSQPSRPPTAPESSGAKVARELLSNTFNAQNKYQDVDEQTANSVVSAGSMIGVPVQKTEIPTLLSRVGLGKPKYRISLSGGQPIAPVAAPRPAVPASGGKIKVSNGKETLFIDPADEASAAADGYQRV